MNINTLLSLIIQPVIVFNGGLHQAFPQSHQQSSKLMKFHIQPLSGHVNLELFSVVQSVNNIQRKENDYHTHETL